MSDLRIGSLFSGYGGLEQGVQSVLGGTVAWHSEIDPGACKILAHRYPDVPNLGDITAVDWTQVEPVDVLTGGFPCQDVSSAGKRRGLNDDTRSGLWAQMVRAIDELRPPLVVAENVRGLLSACALSELEPCPRCLGDESQPHRPVLRALGRVVGDLSELGYVGRWGGLRAADVGAPHGRFRVFIVAWPAQDADVAASGERWLAAPGQAQGGWARADAGGRGGAPAAYAHGGPVRQQPVPLSGCSSTTFTGLAGTDAAADADKRGRRANLADLRAGEPDALGCTAADADGSGLGRFEELHGIPRTGSEGGGHGHDAHGLALAPRGLDRPEADWGTYTAAVQRWERTLGRLAPNPTERGAKGQPRLSPAFVEWMMGLPAGWVTDVPGLTRNEQLKALGNGVVPQQAAHALRLLLPDVVEAAA